MIIVKRILARLVSNDSRFASSALHANANTRTALLTALYLFPLVLSPVNHCPATVRRRSPHRLSHVACPRRLDEYDAK